MLKSESTQYSGTNPTGQTHPLCGTPEYIEAKRLLAFLEWFLPLDMNLIPETSIVREFLGGSILKDFTVWKNK